MCDISLPGRIAQIEDAERQLEAARAGRANGVAIIAMETAAGALAWIEWWRESEDDRHLVVCYDAQDQRGAQNGGAFADLESAIDAMCAQYQRLATEQPPAAPPQCAYLDCHAPATVRLRFDSEPERDWFYCDAHADLAIDAAWDYGEAVIANERLDVADAGDVDGPDDDTDPDLPPVPPPPIAEAQAILDLHAQADASDQDAERTLARMDSEGAYRSWRGFSAPDTCEAAGCSRPATTALTDENVTGPHMRYLCTPHAAVRRALAARPGARFHITNDVRIAEAAR